MQYPLRKRVELWAESHREPFPGPEMSWSLPGCMWIFTDWDPHTPFLLWFLPFLNGTPVTAILCKSHHSYCGAGEDSWEVPWTARRSNQSILKEINPEYSLEGLMLKFPYFGHLMQRADSLEKTLMLGKIEGRRRRGQQRMRWLDRIINSMDMSLRKLWESVKSRETWHATVHMVVKSWTQLSNCTTTTTTKEKSGTEEKALRSSDWIGVAISQGMSATFRR